MEMTVDVINLVPKVGKDLQFVQTICLPAQTYAMADHTVEVKFNGIALKQETKAKGTTVRIKGSFQALLHCFCDACLDPVDIPVLAEANELFLSVPDELHEDAYFFEGQQIDLTDMVMSQVLLNIPMTVRCSNSCKGLCPGCGCNLNEISMTCACKEVC